MSQTIHIADGEQVYPCRCGETHRGEYAAYTYGHHNCLHNTPLVPIGPEAHMTVCCPLCGLTWEIAA